MAPATDSAGVMVGFMGSSSGSIGVVLGTVELSFAIGVADDEAALGEVDEGLPLELESSLAVVEVVAASDAVLEVGTAEDAAVGLAFCCSFADLVSTDRFCVDVSCGLDVAGGEAWRGSIS